MTQIDEPNIDDKIREMLFSWHKWRDYYYSDLKEQVITDDEWKVTRDKIDDDAIKAIKAFIATQIKEAYKRGWSGGWRLGSTRMTNPMAPTEQDNELREKLVETILSILGITDRSSGNRSEQIATLEQEIVSYITADRKRVALEARKVTGDTSDGYHTFNELYDYRRVYNAALFNEWASQGKYDVHKSWKHSDGKDCFGGGWFIVVAELPTGQASNHYEAQYWDNFVIPSKDTANEYDGHTPNQALSRIAQLRSTQ